MFSRKKSDKMASLLSSWKTWDEWMGLVFFASLVSRGGLFGTWLWVWCNFLVVLRACLSFTPDLGRSRAILRAVSVRRSFEGTVGLGQWNLTMHETNETNIERFAVRSFYWEKNHHLICCQLLWGRVFTEMFVLKFKCHKETSKVTHPGRLNMEPYKLLRKENDLPNAHEYMFQPLIFRGVRFKSTIHDGMTSDMPHVMISDFSQDQGLGLHELTVLAATLEHLIHDEVRQGTGTVWW